tara:strand:+ start:46411 stop:46545 length:135 start_codon:yes stop_codon:yes gene_type:complete
MLGPLCKGMEGRIRKENVKIKYNHPHIGQFEGEYNRFCIQNEAM